MSYHSTSLNLLVEQHGEMRHAALVELIGPKLSYLMAEMRLQQKSKKLEIIKSTIFKIIKFLRIFFRMFELICDHLRYATNNGNLRSAITVFKQRLDKNHDFRIWNAQVLNYAGYEISETETLGDRAQIEFTKVNF